MDVHKESISRAIADEGAHGDVRPYRAIDHTMEALDKVTRKLVSTGAHLQFVYETGPCGFGIYRHLKDQTQAVSFQQFTGRKVSMGARSS